MHIRAPVSAFLALMVSAVIPVAAQQTSPATQTFTAGIDLVQVDVAVLDRSRRPVRGLTAGDFTLLVDGKPQAVAAFAAVDVPARAPVSKTEWMREVPADVATNDVPAEGRLVVIVLDRSIPIGLPSLTARNVARAAIDQLAPGDLAAVVYTGSGAPQDFTSDRGRLLAAIGDNPAAGLSPDATGRWQVQQDQLEAEIWSDEDAARGIARTLPANVSGECQCGICVLEAVTSIADAVRDTPTRRKSLLFIGSDIVTDVPIENVRSGDPGRDTCYYPVIDAREAMFTSLDQANLTVHAFDVNALESSVVSASAQAAGTLTPISPAGAGQNASQQRLTRQGHLAVLPDRTGGRLVKNTNGPEDRVPDIFRESDAYYVLGFEPANDGREHTISVRVNRGDVSVSSRHAYTASPRSATAATTPMDPADRAIASVIPTRKGVTLTAAALALGDAAGHDPTLLVALHAKHDVSTGPVPAGAEQIDLVTAVFRPDGRPVGTFRQTIGVTTVGTAASGVAYDVLQRIPAKPGRYELRIAVDNPGRGQSGSVFAFVEIPALDKTHFGWSDIGLASTSARPVANESVTDLVPAPPIARRDFDRQEHVTAYISGYHVSGDLPSPIEIVSRIVDDGNHRKFEQKASLSAADFGASHAASYMLDLPLSTLEPGAYLLSMETRAGKAKTTRYVRFSVR